MKTAFVFPGQGSQKVGMLQDLYNAYPIVKQRFEEADEALGYSISKLCFEGPDTELVKTANTQPAILTASVACYEVLKEQGFTPDIVGGHSLGEYSALVAAGVLNLKMLCMLFINAVNICKKLCHWAKVLWQQFWLCLVNKL